MPEPRFDTPLARPGGAPSSAVLYAEDDPDDAFFMERAFRASEVKETLHVVTDGEEAIAYLSGSGKFSDRGRFPLPGLVLLDLNMPFVTGFDVLKWIRGTPAFAMLPVFVLTSSSLEADRQHAAHLGANRYVVKPGHPDDLVALAQSFAIFRRNPTIGGGLAVEAPAKPSER